MKNNKFKKSNTNIGPINYCTKGNGSNMREIYFTQTDNYDKQK